MAQAASASQPARSTRFRQSAYRFGNSSYPRRSQSRGSHPSAFSKCSSCPPSASWSHLSQGDSASPAPVHTTRRPRTAHMVSQSPCTNESSLYIRAQSASIHNAVQPAFGRKLSAKNPRDFSKSQEETVILYAWSPHGSSGAASDASSKSLDIRRGPASVQRSVPSPGTARRLTKSASDASLPQLPKSPVQCSSSHCNSPADEPLSSSGGASPHRGPGSSGGASPHRGPGSSGGASPHRGPGSSGGASLYRGSVTSGRKASSAGRYYQHRAHHFETMVTSAPLSSASVSSLTITSSRSAEHSKPDTKQVVASSASQIPRSSTCCVPPWRQISTNSEELTPPPDPFLPSSSRHTQAKPYTKRKTDRVPMSETPATRCSTNTVNEDGTAVCSKVDIKTVTSSSVAPAGASLHVPVPKRFPSCDPHSHDSDSTKDSLNLPVSASCDGVFSAALVEMTSTAGTAGTSISSEGSPVEPASAGDKAANPSRPGSPYPSAHNSSSPASVGIGSSRLVAVSRSGGLGSQSPLVVAPARPPASGTSGACSFPGEGFSVFPTSQNSDASSPSTMSASLIPLMSPLPDFTAVRNVAGEKQDHHDNLLKSRMKTIEEILKNVTMKTLLTMDEIKELSNEAHEALMKDDVKTVIENKMSINLLKSMIKEAKRQQRKVYEMYKSLQVELA